MNKRRWRLLIFFFLLLTGIFTMQHFEKGEEKAITTILDHVDERDAVELFQNNKSVFREEGNKSASYMEENPLSFIMDLSKKDRSIFEDEPAYTIVYEIDGKPLYEVEILKLAISSELTDELQKMLFTVGDSQYIIYWPAQKKVLQQSEHTQKMLEQYGQ